MALDLVLKKHPGALAVFVPESGDAPGVGLREGIRPDLQATDFRHRQMPKLFQITEAQNNLWRVRRRPKHQEALGGQEPRSLF